ncbi:MAG: hypothetical protein KAG70_05690, partial [Alcanivorax sp.]|nr:hypothetical protein [Alcanivorax sp.]
MIIVEKKGIDLRHARLLPDCKPDNSDGMTSADNDPGQKEEAFQYQSHESRKTTPGSRGHFSQLASRNEKVDRSISRVL